MQQTFYILISKTVNACSKYHAVNSVSIEVKLRKRKISKIKWSKRRKLKKKENKVELNK